MKPEQNSHNTIVTILGSGTCVPSLKRSSCSVLVESAGCKFLLDAGAGTMRRLLHTGTEVFDISYLFFSHFHPDHIGELVPFIFANKYPDGTHRKKPLTLIGGKGFQDFFYQLEGVFGEWIRLPSELFSIVELNGCNFDQRFLAPFTIGSLPVNHRPESVAIRITDPNGKSLVYSGDTDFSENLITLASNSHLLICESSFPDQLKVPGHLTPSLAGEIASRANVSTLMLTHFYPECDHEDIEKQCRKTYKGPLILAEDLMVLGLE